MIVPALAVLFVALVTATAVRRDLWRRHHRKYPELSAVAAVTALALGLLGTYELVRAVVTPLPDPNALPSTPMLWMIVFTILGVGYTALALATIVVNIGEGIVRLRNRHPHGRNGGGVATAAPYAAPQEETT